jgi:hypothetical protein
MVRRKTYPIIGDPPLTERQRRVLFRMSHGWWLECSGREDLAGIMGRPGSKHATARVSVSDMNALFLRYIRRPYDDPEYELTDEGREAAKC